MVAEVLGRHRHLFPRAGALNRPDELADSACASEQTAPCPRDSIHSTLPLLRSAGNWKDDKMYIGGGLLLLIIVLYLIFG